MTQRFLLLYNLEYDTEETNDNQSFTLLDIIRYGIETKRK